MIDQVIEGLTPGRHAQARHEREVGLGALARPVALREEYLPRRFFRGPPVLHAPLQRAQLTVGEPARITPLQVVEERLRFKSRIKLKPGANLLPHLCKRILARAPRVRLADFARQLVQLHVLARRLLVHPRLVGRCLQCLFPVGWNAVGTCTSITPPGLYTTNRDSAAAHLAVMREYGINTIIEPASADGRIVARAVTPDWYNWYTNSSFQGDHDYRAGHPRPGAYVEGLIWLMDEAMADSVQPVRVMPSLSHFIRPGYERQDGLPYSGDDVLSCEEYSTFIDQERSLIGPGVPSVSCPSLAKALPFWEWNIWYIVSSLRDHAGLLGWYLIDEPEGITYRHLFGIAEPDESIAAYDGPQSLPTPDLLRYTYNLVKAFESDGRSSDYRARPIIVDISEPHSFFSNRFSWSHDGRLNPRYSSGPFDRTSDGGFHVPADILGLEASGGIVHTGARGDLDRHEWYWDPNFATRDASMLMEVVRTDSLWGTITVAAQAQLPSEGPYAAYAPVRCEPNDQLRTRLLNDRDIVWQLLSTSALGVRGHLYYSHALMPAVGEGAEQVQRSNRAIQQFLSAGLDEVMMSARVDDEWQVNRIWIDALTDYHRHDHAATGSGNANSLGAAGTLGITVDREGYRVASFGRSGDARSYGEPVLNPPWSTHAEHELLQFAAHRFEDNDYLVIANSYDSRIVAIISSNAPVSQIDEGIFDLTSEGVFKWQPQLDRLSSETVVNGLRINLEPYEARVFRIPLE